MKCSLNGIFYFSSLIISNKKLFHDKSNSCVLHVMLWVHNFEQLAFTKRFASPNYICFQALTISIGQVSVCGISLISMHCYRYKILVNGDNMLVASLVCFRQRVCNNWWNSFQGRNGWHLPLVITRYIKDAPMAWLVILSINMNIGWPIILSCLFPYIMVQWILCWFYA